MDIDHYFSADASPDLTGGATIAAGLTASQQRIIRRVLTNPGDYTANPDYGAGAGRFVGTTPQGLNQLKTLISSQILLEPSVAPYPFPKVELKTNYEMLYITIEYVDVPTNTTQLLAFSS